MNLYTIDTGMFKLDGGAMFGVVPKTIWSRTNVPDENNLCTWAMRSLLIEDGDRLILIDNGMGDKQDAKFFSYYYPHGEGSLEKSLKAAGFSTNDVTDVFLTHLHFDHCGGGVKYSQDKTKLELTFKNARYWSNEAHWNWAVKPNAREKASFLRENILPMQESGHLNFIDIHSGSPFEYIDIFFADGHTEKQMLPLIRYKDKTIAFVADLIPSVGHLPIPYVMGYDVRPLMSMDEKGAFLQQAVENDYILFFEHDPVNECATLVQTEKGVRMKEVYKLSEVV